MTRTLSLFPDVDESLVPGRVGTGALPHDEIQTLIAARRIRASAPFDADQVQPASLDLRLGRKCYRVQSSFLPGRSRSVASRLEDLTMHELDLAEPTVLERGCVYVVEAMEEVKLNDELSARANPKSTTGRLDIFTRLITDNAETFDSVAPSYRGKLYVEVSPRTFSVRLRAGTRLNQLRFTRGTPRQWDKSLRDLHETHPIVYDHTGRALMPDIDDGLWIHIDLSGRDRDGVVGYRARRNTALVDLAHIRHHPWQDFWEPIVVAGGRTNLTLTPDDFYILVSAEFVSVPLTHAAELESIATDVGEFRIHYAGFFDPGFGYGAGGEVRGTPAVLEVRSHEVPFLLEHGQTVGRFRYEKLSSPATTPYGTTGSSYHAQRLALAKQFR